MKHSIRSRTVDPVRGHVVKVEKVFGQLGSGVLDKHGREIFEGDIVKIHDAEERTTFEDGSFFINDRPIWRLKSSELEIIGHDDD